jgi:hypothetical protein
VVRRDGATVEATETGVVARRQTYVPGTPIFDAVGLWVGIVDAGLVRVHADALRMRPGWRAKARIDVPLATIVRADPDGIYLESSNTLPEARV